MENRIVLYTTPGGNVSVQVQFEDGTFWLTQKRMAELFGVDVRTVNDHSADYDKDSPVTKDFFASVQNKLHWAITGKTVAEIIYTSADASKLYMGLTHWKQAPDGKIMKSDVTVAKTRV